MTLYLRHVIHQPVPLEESGWFSLLAFKTAQGGAGFWPATFSYPLPGSQVMLRSIFSTTCPEVALGFIWEDGSCRLWLYPARATSRARMAMATHRWETHQRRPLSPEAELLVLLFPGLPWNMPPEWSRRGRKPLYLGGTRWVRIGGGGGGDRSCFPRLAGRPGKDLLAWLHLGCKPLRIAIHPTRLSELPGEIHL